MEKMLIKLAKQLDSLDEASLMALWSKYATITSRFEPSKRWEEACLIFSLIQAKHMKNQLFNYCWSQQRTPPMKNAMEKIPPIEVEFELESPANEKIQTEKCQILPFSLNNNGDNKKV